MTTPEENLSLRSDDREIDTECYQEIEFDGAFSSCCQFYRLFMFCRFMQAFASMKSFSDNVCFFIPYLWKKRQAGEEIDRDFIITELARWIGRNRLDEEIVKNPRDFEEMVQIVFDFLSSAKKEYYSGFCRFFRSLENKNSVTREKIKKWYKPSFYLV